VSEDSVRSMLVVEGKDAIRKLCAYLFQSRDAGSFPLLVAAFPFLQGQLRTADVSVPEEPVRQTTHRGGSESLYCLRLTGILLPTSLAMLLRLLAQEQAGSFKAQLRSRPNCTPLNHPVGQTLSHPWEDHRAISYHDGQFHFVSTSK